jgi:hypothetical protein
MGAVWPMIREVFDPPPCLGALCGAASARLRRGRVLTPVLEGEFRSLPHSGQILGGLREFPCFVPVVLSNRRGEGVP